MGVQVINFFKATYNWYDNLVDGASFWVDGLSLFLSFVNVALLVRAWKIEALAVANGIETANKIEYPNLQIFIIFCLVIPFLPFLLITIRNLMNLLTFELGPHKPTCYFYICLAYFGHYAFIKMAIDFTPSL